MPISFKKAPLAELVAELRWVPSTGPGTDLTDLMVGSTSSAEESYMKFGARVHQHGFSRSERLFPPGFMSPLYQPIYRYRRGENEPAELMHVGIGLFSANALKPYQSWHAFRPSVVAGVQALLESRSPPERAIPFSTVSLRYVNGFDPALTDERHPGGVIRDVLGFKADLPPAIVKHSKNAMPASSNLTFVVPLKNGLQLRISTYDGAISGTPAVVLDLIASFPDAVAPNVESVLAAFDAERNELHSIFIELTKDIHAEMEPEGDDDR